LAGDPLGASFDEATGRACCTRTPLDERSGSDRLRQRQGAGAVPIPEHLQRFELKPARKSPWFPCLTAGRIPASRAEMTALGYDACDIVLVQATPMSGRDRPWTNESGRGWARLQNRPRLHFGMRPERR